MNSIKTLTAAQSNDLLAHLAAPSGTPAQKRLGARNVAIALLMLDAGLRENEVCLLLQADLFWQDTPRETIDVRSEIAKYKCGGQIPMSKPLRTALYDYHLHFLGMKRAVPYDWAFCGKDPTKRLSTRQIRRFIHDAGIESLGIELNAHMLRHTFIDRLRRCTDLPTVQRLARHKDIRSTMIYTHPAQTELAAAIAKMSQALENQNPCHKIPTT